MSVGMTHGRNIRRVNKLLWIKGVREMQPLNLVLLFEKMSISQSVPVESRARKCVTRGVDHFRLI